MFIFWNMKSLPCLGLKNMFLCTKSQAKVVTENKNGNKQKQHLIGYDLWDLSGIYTPD